MRALLWRVALICGALLGGVARSEVAEVRDGLYDAAFVGDVHAVESLLAADPALITSRSPVLVNRVNNQGRTALMVCGLDPQHEDKARLDAECAVIAKSFHNAGADVDLTDNEGWDALSIAAVRGMSKTVSVLASAGATVDRPDKQGRTPLMKAAAHGHMEVIRALLASGASPTNRDSNGQAAVHFATQLAMHREGVTPIFMKFFRSFLGALAAHPHVVDTADKDGRSALMYAAIRGDAEVCRALLVAGADPRLRDKFGVWLPTMARDRVLQRELLEAATRRTERDHALWLDETEVGQLDPASTCPALGV